MAVKVIVLAKMVLIILIIIIIKPASEVPTWKKGNLPGATRAPRALLRKGGWPDPAAQKIAESGVATS